MFLVHSAVSHACHIPTKMPPCQTLTNYFSKYKQFVRFIKSVNYLCRYYEDYVNQLENWQVCCFWCVVLLNSTCVLQGRARMIVTNEVSLSNWVLCCHPLPNSPIYLESNPLSYYIELTVHP